MKISKAFVGALILFGACSDSPISTPALITLSLRTVEGTAVPVTFFGLGGSTRTVLGGTLTGSSGSASCRYIIEMYNAADPEGDISGCTLEAGITKSVSLNLGTTGGPSGNLTYRFE